MSLLWNIFGNNDDWPPPDWYKSDSAIWWRKFCWLLRNPLHNFTFYIIGLKGKKFLRFKEIDEIYRLVSDIDYFEPERVVRAYLLYKNKKYSFRSYLHFWNSKRQFDCYIGRRPYDGAFGIKFRPYKKRN